MIPGMASDHDSSPSAAEKRLLVHNRLAEIATVTDALEAFAMANGVPETITWRFQLALEELLRNVIAHAYMDDDDHDIDIHFQCFDTKFAATITDGGIPFNPLNAEPPDLSDALDEREIGGLGIHLARNVVEEFEYAWENGNNVVTLQSDFGTY
jgi:anti-sigma regulatory factor (Ser/Thr protein kinase)